MFSRWHNNKRLENTRDGTRATQTRGNCTLRGEAITTLVSSCSLACQPRRHRRRPERHLDAKADNSSTTTNLETRLGLRNKYRPRNNLHSRVQTANLETHHQNSPRGRSARISHIKRRAPDGLLHEHTTAHDPHFNQDCPVASHDGILSSHRLSSQHAFKFLNGHRSAPAGKRQPSNAHDSAAAGREMDHGFDAAGSAGHLCFNVHPALRPSIPAAGRSSRCLKGVLVPLEHHGRGDFDRRSRRSLEVEG
ncbi:hypothetical protein QBC39DRAFT_359638 [Podospora conica]|nr:hypothetical protein QBC39DRAFT_359638 [Schizothecium conicum]